MHGHTVRANTKHMHLIVETTNEWTRVHVCAHACVCVDKWSVNVRVFVFLSVCGRRNKVECTDRTYLGQ